MNDSSEKRIEYMTGFISDPELRDLLVEFVKQDVDLKMGKAIAEGLMSPERMANILLHVLEDVKTTKMPYDAAAKKFSHALSSALDVIGDLRSFLGSLTKPEATNKNEKLVTAVLKTQELRGVNITDKPVGTKYLIDLNSKSKLHWLNSAAGIDEMIDGVRVVDEDGGWMPFDLFELEA